MKKILPFALLCALCASCQSYKGRSEFNQIEAGREYALGEIREIRSFHALFVRSDTVPHPMIHYILAIDAKADYSPNVGPYVQVMRQGVKAAVFSPSANKLPQAGRNEVWMEWETDTQVDPRSFVFIQFRPNTDKMVSVKIPFNQADCALQDGNRRRAHISFEELLKEARVSPPQ